MNIDFRGFLITVDETISIGSADGDISSKEQILIERMHGCNGTVHIDHLAKVYYKKTGEIEFAEDLGYHSQRHCDGTCFGKPTVGEFLTQAV